MTAVPLVARNGLPDPERDAQFYDGVKLRRTMAGVIDMLISLAFGFLAATLFGLGTLGFGFVLFPLVSAAAALAYRVATLGSGQSATWGMRMFGIEIRRADGERLTMAEAFMHAACFMATFLIPIVALINLIVMAVSPMGRGLHDLPLGSTAINRPV